jgi:hypothetical protein
MERKGKMEVGVAASGRPAAPHTTIGNTINSTINSITNSIITSVNSIINSHCRMVLLSVVQYSTNCTSNSTIGSMLTISIIRLKW